MINERLTTTNLEVTAPPRRTSRRWPIFLLLIPTLLLLLVVGGLLGYEWAHANQVFPGVRVAGIDLSGKDGAAAAGALQAINTQAAQASTIKLTYDGKERLLAGRDLGLRIDVAAAVAEAMKVGRSGDFFADLGTQWQAINHPHELTPAWQYDEASLRTALASLHAEIDRPVVNASLVVGSDGSLQPTASQVGRRLDEQATVERLAAAATTPGPPQLREVAAVIVEQSPAITEQQWAAAAATARTTLQPFTISYPDRGVQLKLTTYDVNGLVRLTPPQDNTPAQLTIDQQGLRAFVTSLSPQINAQAVDARLVIDQQTVWASIIPDSIGYELEVDAAVNMINDNLTTVNRSVVLPVKVITADTTAAELEPTLTRAESLLDKGFQLRYEGGPWNIVGAKMAVMLDVATGADGQPAITFKQDVLAGKLDVIGGLIKRNARDGLYRLGADGRAFIAQQPIDGREMLIAETQAAVNQQLAAGTSAVDVVFAVNPAPQYDLSQPLNFPDVLASASTSLQGSSPERAFNVTLGTNNFNDTVIPPGAIYSASDAFGPIDEEHGFKTGFAIVRSGQNISTIPTVGGGICQVATTFFQTAYWTGLKVVERRGHMYWIGTYGRPPLGRLGLDATVYQYDTDLRVQNTTGNWLRVRSWVSADMIVHFDLLGTTSGWQVAVSEPKITKYVKTSQTMVYEAEPSWPVGQTRYVEHAQDGFDSSISRTVRDSAGNVIDQLTLNSHYEPAHNRTLVGSGGKKTLPAQPAAPPQP